MFLKFSFLWKGGLFAPLTISYGYAHDMNTGTVTCISQSIILVIPYSRFLHIINWIDSIYSTFYWFCKSVTFTQLSVSMHTGTISLIYSQLINIKQSEYAIEKWTIPVCLYLQKNDIIWIIQEGTIPHVSKSGYFCLSSALYGISTLNQTEVSCSLLFAGFHVPVWVINLSALTTTVRKNNGLTRQIITEFLFLHYVWERVAIRLTFEIAGTATRAVNVFIEIVSRDRVGAVAEDLICDSAINTGRSILLLGVHLK